MNPLDIHIDNSVNLILSFHSPFPKPVYSGATACNFVNASHGINFIIDSDAFENMILFTTTISYCSTVVQLVRAAVAVAVLVLILQKKFLHLRHCY